MEPETKHCGYCGVWFTAILHSERKYCTPQCLKRSMRYLRKKTNRKVMAGTHVCVLCESVFKTKAQVGSNPKYCSGKCARYVEKRKLFYLTNSPETISILRSIYKAGQRIYAGYRLSQFINQKAKGKTYDENTMRELFQIIHG